MQPLRCSECSAQVLVAKNSWEHTSIQWDAAARALCHEIDNDAPNDGRLGAPSRGCHALSASIVDAANRGDVVVTDSDPVPTPIVVD
ncbi:hypothetical protein O1W68_01540 [Rhodococcus sp. H36-A4]|uniref:hypothetical protein n=1 Tax=Rhodococcus sp. H36-A4 TaxID=3004353 RepID=UPI0022B05B83|nr:hypothetical protein [Rhodococcus sp. H36-A4]MCZ4076614.1 hypothetical protein [Rhodococcus sp. H36-A4]